MGIAFFDLDQTLLSINSGTLWVRRELRLKHIGRLQVVRAASWMLRYHLGFASVDTALARAIGLLAGHSERELRSRTEQFYEEEVRHLFRPGGRRAVERHRAKGDLLVLLTASSSYLAELAVRDLKLDAALANRFEVDAHGLHTGRSLGALCFGVGKLTHARTFADAHQVALKDCTFYTDSFSDVPVLEAVGTPVMIAPDPMLRRLARRRGWRIEEWGGPGLASGYPKLAG